jgi:hypothetical protein
MFAVVCCDLYLQFWPFLQSNEKDRLCYFAVDSKARAADGSAADPTVNLLRQKVEELAQAEAYIDKQIPFGWLKVLDRLQTLSQECGANDAAPIRRLPLQEVYAIATECGLPSDSNLSLEEEVGALLDLFHELGMLVHYNDPKFREMIILDPQWLIDLISRLIRVYNGKLHELPVDEKARRQMPQEWRGLVEEGKLTRRLVELLWDDLTDDTAERRTLLDLLQNFDLLLHLKESEAQSARAKGEVKLAEEQVGRSASCSMHHIFLVPSMLPDGDVAKPSFLSSRLEGNPSFYLVFCADADGSGEMTLEGAAKGFLPEGLFPRLLKKAANWHQCTASGTAVGGMKPVFFRSWAQLSFGNHIFVLELLEAQQMIKVQLLVKNPTLVLERIEQMVEEIKAECMAQLDYFVAVAVPEAEGLLLSLERVQQAIAGGAPQLFVGRGLRQHPVPRDAFTAWCPPAVEEEYDIFISYRQASDTVHARLVYDCLSKIAYEREDGRRLNVFLDSVRLLGGLSWKEGFIDGLMCSKIMVPIVSKGCLEPMAKLDPANGQDWCDNVLLEWKLGLELVKTAGSPLTAIYPIMVGSEDPQTGKMLDFFGESAAVELSAAPSVATDLELDRVLCTARRQTALGGASGRGSAGAGGSEDTAEAPVMGIAQTKSKILEQLGVKAWDPTSTHGNDYDGTAPTHWDIHQGCANRIYQVSRFPIKKIDQGLTVPFASCISNLATRCCCG